jgi:GPH family glycoside/pentoside/hexuronide:cation symporter
VSAHLAKTPMTALQKAIYALGDHSVSVSLSSLSLVYFTFLVTVAGVEPWLAGTIAWVARLVDAISDPYMGRLSDATTWRLGRRRPYFLIGMLPFGLFFGLLWLTPFSEQASMFFYYLVVYIGLCLSMTVVGVPYMALIPEMSEDYDERTSINTWRSGGAVLGTMIAAVFFGLADWFGGGSDGYARAGALIAVWIVLPWPAVFAVSRESQRRAPTTHSSMRHGLGRVLKHGNYLRLSALYIAGRIAMDLLGLAIPLYIIVWLKRDGDVQWTLLSMLVVVVLSLPLWLRYARRNEKHSIFILGALWWAALLSFMWFAQPDWPRWMLFGVGGLIGIGYAVVDLMPWAMLGEVIDEGERINGERSEGIYNGIFTFIRKVGGASAYMIAGIALSLAGYDSEASEQSDAALTTIRLTASVIPAAFLLIAVLAARGYPLTRARHNELLDALEAGRRPEPTR